MPTFAIEGADFSLETPEMAAVPRCFMNGPPVISLAGNRHEIIAALDFLFQGY